MCAVRLHRVRFVFALKVCKSGVWKLALTEGLRFAKDSLTMNNVKVGFVNLPQQKGDVLCGVDSHWTVSCGTWSVV